MRNSERPSLKFKRTCLTDEERVILCEEVIANKPILTFLRISRFLVLTDQRLVYYKEKSDFLLNNPFMVWKTLLIF